MRRALWLLALGLLVAPPARASLGGPDLTRPLGWDPTTKEAYFAIAHWNESGQMATIVRLKLDAPDTTGCQPVWWSKQASYGDSLYDGRLRRLTKKLLALKEVTQTTIPDLPEILSKDTLMTTWSGPFERYHVRMRFRTEGTVEAITYRDPSVRMIRYYYFPELKVGVGLFSFVGIPDESAYELQIPAILPMSRGSHVLLQWHQDW